MQNAPRLDGPPHRRHEFGIALAHQHCQDVGVGGTGLLSALDVRMGVYPEHAQSIAVTLAQISDRREIHETISTQGHDRVGCVPIDCRPRSGKQIKEHRARYDAIVNRSLVLDSDGDRDRFFGSLWFGGNRG